MPRAAGDARDVFHFKEEQEEGRGDEGKKMKVYIFMSDGLSGLGVYSRRTCHGEG